MTTTTAPRVRCSDCAHAIDPPTDSCGTGYATLPDGRHVCYACAARRDREAIDASEPGDRFVGYLSGDGRHVTTWPGDAVMIVRREAPTRAGFGGSMTQVWARDSLGRVWYGRNAGRCMVLSLRLTKQTSR